MSDFISRWLEPKPKCPDCGAKVGEKHRDGCDVERCPRCGNQYISCPCVYEKRGLDLGTFGRRQTWTGLWPGVAECAEFGWYAKRWDGPGYVPCEPDDPDCEGYDLNRLRVDAVWDAKTGRYVKRDTVKGHVVVNAAVRTPAQVIALALEDEGVEPDRARHLSEQAAQRLAVALRSVSDKESTTILYSPTKGQLGWGHVRGKV